MSMAVTLEAYVSNPAGFTRLLKVLRKTNTGGEFIWNVITWLWDNGLGKHSHSFPERTSVSYLFFFPAAPVKVVDLYNHVILLPREPLNSDAGVCRPGHWAQNVITEEKATESDKIFTQMSSWNFPLLFGAVGLKPFWPQSGSMMGLHYILTEVSV